MVGLETYAVSIASSLGAVMPCFSLRSQVLGVSVRSVAVGQGHITSCTHFYTDLNATLYHTCGFLSRVEPLPWLSVLA